MTTDQEEEATEEQAESETEQHATETQDVSNTKQDPVRWATLFVFIFCLVLFFFEPSHVFSYALHVAFTVEVDRSGLLPG